MLNNKEIKLLLDFNKKAWPKRKNKSETVIDWRIFKNPYFTSFEKDLIAIENNKVVGQIIPIYSKFTSGDQNYDCVWGSDYMVDEEARGGNAGVKVLKTMIKKYLHFGVGMSDVSLKMHKVFRESEITIRHDFLFLAGKKNNREIQYINPEKFITQFDNKFAQINLNTSSINYFGRNSLFYNWIFQQANTKKIKIAIDVKTQGYVLFYNTTYKGIPLVKIIDYSANFLNDQEALLSIIESNGAKSFKKLFFFSGTIDFSKKVKSFRKRVFPVYSNIKIKKLEYQEQSQFHITGLDSDRFINSFL